MKLTLESAALLYRFFPHFNFYIFSREMVVETKPLYFPDFFFFSYLIFVDFSRKIEFVFSALIHHWFAPLQATAQFISLLPRTRLAIKHLPW